MCLAHFLGQMLKCCYPLKSELKSHKINILVQIKGIEGIPFITRFKTILGSLEANVSAKEY